MTLNKIKRGGGVNSYKNIENVNVTINSEEIEECVLVIFLYTTCLIVESTERSLNV